MLALTDNLRKVGEANYCTIASTTAHKEVSIGVKAVAM